MSAVATLWSGYTWVSALKHARELSAAGAVVSVAIPVLWQLSDQLQDLAAG